MFFVIFFINIEKAHYFDNFIIKFYMICEKVVRSIQKVFLIII